MHNKPTEWNRNNIDTKRIIEKTIIPLWLHPRACKSLTLCNSLSAIHQLSIFRNQQYSATVAPDVDMHMQCNNTCTDSDKICIWHSTYTSHQNIHTYVYMFRWRHTIFRKTIHEFQDILPLPYHKEQPLIYLIPGQ